MPIKTKIAIREPLGELSDRYFSVKLKQEYPAEPFEYESPSRLLIISGMCGDFKHFRTQLFKSGIIDRSYNWIFGDGHLVIAGNCFGYNGIGVECLWLAYALEEKARRKGGYVHFILGRNEIMNIDGSWCYSTPQYANNPKTSKPPYVVLYDGNGELRRWIQTKNVVEKIGNILVSNLDLSARLSEHNFSPDQLNVLTRQYKHSRSKEMTFLNHNYSLEHEGKKLEEVMPYRITVKRMIDLLYVFTSNEVDERGTDILLVVNNQFYKVNAENKYTRVSFTN